VVARTRAPGRLNDIVDAAADVFSSLGYRRARMQEVAAAAGVSPGLLYTYAAGKEALFLLVVQREAGVDVDALPLPVPNPDPAEFVALLRKTLRTRMRTPALTAAEKLTRRPTNPRAELEAIVTEQYDGLARGRAILRVIERSAADWPELADEFYNRVRKPHIQRLRDYVQRRVDWGVFQDIDADVGARFVIESVAWFANHRLGDFDGAKLPDDVTRASIIELLTNAFLAR
jgi:AcrR family transcriptional regulator